MSRASPSDKGRTSLPPRLYLVLSHLVVMAIAFHVGTIYGMGAASSAAAEGLAFGCDMDGSGGSDHEILRMHRRSKGCIQRNNVPIGVSDSGEGATLLSRSFFFETFDLGLPWEKDDRGFTVTSTSSNKRHQGNEDEDEKNILLLLPPSVNAKHPVKSFSDSLSMMNRQDLSNACDVVKVVIAGGTDRRDRTPHKESENNPHPSPEQYKVCVAVVRDSPWESYHVHKFMQRDKNSGNNNKNNNVDLERWHQVSRYAGTDALLQNPPKPVSVNESLRLLQQYWEIHEAILDELRPLVENVVASSQHQIRDGWPKNTVVVMVCNAGHATLLLNFVCAARVAHVDLSSVLLFATDATTAQLARELQLAYYYNEKLFASVPSESTVEYGTMAYAQVMMAAKVYSVHLISTLGFDLIFQDVDVVPYRSDYLMHFMNLANGESGNELDLFFQYDHSTQPQYQPWSANSGFYYARNNVRTRYFFSALLRSGDLILRSKSHQAVMNLWLSEHASLFGLRVGVMNAQQSRQYPVGYHFHQDRAFMKDMIHGRIEKPYAFHMNWNNDKDTKRKFNQQLGDWYVDDEGSDSCGAANSVDELVQSVASSAQQCCVIEPIIVCHFRDKPSKMTCESSPLIEDDISFW